MAFLSCSQPFSGVQCTGFSLWCLSCCEWALQATQASVKLWYTGSVAVVYVLCSPSACGIFPDQRSNWCSLYCKANSQPLDHQGSPA